MGGPRIKKILTQSNASVLKIARKANQLLEINLLDDKIKNGTTQLTTGDGKMIGSGELIVILLLVLVLFGGKKLPELARSLGLGIREFKRACHGMDEEEKESHTVEVKAEKIPRPKEGEEENVSR